MRSEQGKQRFRGLVLVLLLAGCSGSDEILDGSHGRTVTDELTEVLQLVVLPTVERLAAFSPVNQPAAPRSALRNPGIPSCTRLDPLCRSGTFEVCGTAPADPVVFHYGRCARPVGLVDGTWRLTQVDFQATADLHLTLDDLALYGRIEYALNDMCWRKNFNSFTAKRRQYSTTIEGSVGYCFASGPGSGRLQVSVAGPSGPLDVLLEFDADVGTAVVVRAEGTTLCNFDPRDGVAECEGDR